MAFFQSPPSLENQFTADRMLRGYLTRRLPREVRAAIEPELEEMGRLAAGPLADQLRVEYKDEPRLVQWDAWGRRVDRIELTPLWKRSLALAATSGLVAIPYERKHAEYSRIHQFALTYLYEPSTAVATCPLAMSDGAAKTLITMENASLLDRALPRLTSRDPEKVWTSGQWMTERTGGSDVAISETIAKKHHDEWRLFGTKWFTSATQSQMALTLARPEGNPPGGRGLALFYVETRDEHGAMNGMFINRLKDKLGTRMVPTAELTLDGARALPVKGLEGGIKNITPMLTITRVWNAIGAIGGMRRAIALARDYANRRVAFGAPLADKPLHVDTLAALEAEYEGAFLLTFRTIELLGREEAKVATEGESAFLRLLTPIVKLTTAKQAVAMASEVLESFGGAGYVEDTGLPRILRDSQVLPIWEGTTNVLSLDVLRVLGRGGSLEGIEREISERVKGADGGALGDAARVATSAFEHARRWAEGALGEGVPALERGARRFAMTLGRALELALLVDHARWAAENGDRRPAAAARRFARTRIDWIEDGVDEADSRALARDD
jgi:alkylation response protein AidB-like acyl-CoA dehydrogenase